MPVTLTLPTDGGSTGEWGALLNAALGSLATFANALESTLAGKAADADLEALAGDVDTAVSSLTSALAGKAASSHTHAESDVTGLVTALAGKASSTHTHAESDVSGLATDLASKADASAVATALAGKASTSHSHAQSDVTNLTTALAGLAPTSRTVATGTGLTGGGDLSADRTIALSAGTQASLGKADTAIQPSDSRLSDARTPTAHTHAESDVTNLASDLSTLTTAVAGKADAASTATALSGKAAASHSHAQSDVTGLTDALAGKAAASHAHSANDITSGTLPIGRGGTGATTAADARTALGAAPAVAAVRSYAFSYPGAVAVTATSTGRRYNSTGATLTISSVAISVVTAPVGASLIVDVLRNGTSIFTNAADRPAIAAGANTATAVPTAGGAWAAGEYLEVLVTQVGSTTPGSGLVGEVIAS